MIPQAVPIEVWQHIFHLTRDIEYSGVRINAMDANSLPWRLSKVCGLWRRAARSYSSLWVYVYLGPIVLGKHAVVVLRTILSASSPLSLDVSLGELYNSKGDIQTDVFNLLCSHCDRWRSLCLYNHLSVTHSWILLSNVKDKLEGLESLAISLPPGSESNGLGSGTNSRQLFMSCPRLTRVSLENVHNLDIPKTVKNFGLRQSKISRSYKQLLETYHLEELHLSTAIGPFEDSIVCKTLKRLFVRRHPDVLDAFTFPMLNELVIQESLGDMFTPKFTSALSSLITRSNCSITRLRVDGFSFKETSSLLDILHVLWEIEEFDMETRGLDPSTGMKLKDLIGPLSLESYPNIHNVVFAPLLPRLTSMEITHPGNTVFATASRDFCSKVIQSRRNPGLLQTHNVSLLEKVRVIIGAPDFYGSQTVWDI